jgi:hypothetical protein
MKKMFTFALGAVFLALSTGSALAQPAGFYKKHHINESFDDLIALPSGWSARWNPALFVKTTGSSIEVKDGSLHLMGDGSGGRGVDVVFPTPQSNATIGASDTWFIEFDWNSNAVNPGFANVKAITISGSKSGLGAAVDSYIDGILGLFSFGDGYFYYWNMDLDGPVDSSTGNPTGPALVFGPAFQRAGADLAATTTLNASAKTDVAYTTGHIYHIAAELNFATQKVVSLTLTDKSDPTNTQTILDKPFLAITQASTNTTPLEDRVVTDLSVISVFSTRSSGGNGNMNSYLDSIEIYRLEPSLGLANVTVNYKNRAGQVIKTRVAADQEVGFIYQLLPSDKEDFVYGSNYYAYDADLTTVQSVEIQPTGATLDVFFKESPVAAGSYVWTGATSWLWNKLDDNFSVGGGSNISYQNENGVAFSDANAPYKEIDVPVNIFLGENDMEILADGYSITGEGKITGVGTISVNPGASGTATLGGTNLLTEGAELASGTLHLKSAEAVQKIKAANGTTLKLEAGATFNKAIEGMGGDLTINTLSDNFFDSNISNVSTINAVLGVKGSNSSDWRARWGITVPEGTQINVTNGVDGGLCAGFGIGGSTTATTATNMQSVKIHLGDSTRLLPNYNQGTSSGLSYTYAKVGELSGTAASLIEGGFVASTTRELTYVVGGLNTDAEFAGTIRPFRDSKWAVVQSPLNIRKVGSGTWTLSGNSPELAGDSVNVMGGILDVKGQLGGLGLKTVEDKDSVTIGAMTVGVGGTFKIPNIEVGTINIDGTFEGSALATGIVFIYGTWKGSLNVTEKDGAYGTVYADQDALIQLDVWDFTNNYNTISALSDIVIDSPIDITVHNEALGDATITLINANPAAANMVYPLSVRVNGEEIYSDADRDGYDDGTVVNTTKYKWDNETYELSIKDGNGIVEQAAAAPQAVSSSYYDLAGKAVSGNVKGFVIKKTLYSDGSVKNSKAILK